MQTIIMTIFKFYLTFFLLLTSFGAITMANTMTSDLIITPIDKALSFTQIKNIDLVKSIIPTLPIRFEDKVSLYLLSPLQVDVTAQLKENQISIQVNITNNHNYEWFIKKDDNLYVYLNGGKRLYYFTNSNFTPPGDGVEIMRLISDDDYRLIRPKETLTFQREISAEELYKNWRGQDIFIKYNVTGLPPSIADIYLQLYYEDQKNKIYEDYVVANQVRIRCYGYDKEHELYQCDIDNNDHTKFR